jgi:methionyl-tRNA synthetase
VLPRLAAGVEAMLGIPELTWGHAWQHLPAGHAIKPYKHLLTRIDAKQIVALVEANK